MSILWPILSDAHFSLSYERVNYCKIAKDIIKIAILPDRRHFIVYIYVSTVFNFCLRNIIQKQNNMSVSMTFLCLIENKNFCLHLRVLSPHKIRTKGFGNSLNPRLLLDVPNMATKALYR